MTQYKLTTSGCVYQYTFLDRCSQYLYNNFHLSSQISNVTLVDGGQSVKFSTEVIFSPEKYEIV